MAVNQFLHKEEKAILGVELEATEGTPETIVAADTNLLIYDLEFETDIARFVRNAVTTGDVGRLKTIIGSKSGRIRGRFEMKGHGGREAVPAVTDEPEYGDILVSCGRRKATIETMDIGAVTSGPFVDGEVITGGTSSATGRVFKDTADGATSILFETLTGTFVTTETLTGGTSGATATSASGPSDWGLGWWPSDSQQSATYRFLLNSGSGNKHIYMEIAGARGDLELGGPAGAPWFGRFDVQGRVTDIDDVDWTDTPTFDPGVPPIGENLGFSFMGYDAATAANFNYRSGWTVTRRPDFNSGQGIASYYHQRREPAIEIDPEITRKESFDFWDNLSTSADGEAYLEMSAGTDPGDKVGLYFPKVSIEDIRPTVRDGIRAFQTTLAVVRDVNGFTDRDGCITTR